MKTLTEAEIKKFQQRAKYVATKWGYPELADDFSQELFVYFLQKPDRGATVDQLFIDYLRARYGHSRTGGNRSRLQAERNYVELDELRDLADGSRAIDVDWERLGLFRGPEIEDLERIDRIFLILTFKWGFTLKELGELIGVTESGACLVLSKAVSEYKKQIEKRDKDPERIKMNEQIANIKKGDSELDKKTEAMIEKVKAFHAEWIKL
jgi:DNA-directed RNA polymerase specialized sigma24 family protein